VFNFPWGTTLLMKLMRWLPDRILAKAMKGCTGDALPLKEGKHRE